MKGGCGSVTGDSSRDISSVPTPNMVWVASFPILTTIEPLFKQVREDEGPNNEPPQSTLATTANTINNLEEGGWACPILEETPPSWLVLMSSSASHGSPGSECYLRFFCHLWIVWLQFCVFGRINFVNIITYGYLCLLNLLNSFCNSLFRLSSIFYRLGLWYHHLRPPLAQATIVILILSV